MTPPNNDWAAIGVDWHNFKLSIMDIAKRHGLSETAVRKGGRKRVERGEWAARPSHRAGRRPAGAPDLAAETPMPPPSGDPAIYIPRFNAAGRELPPVGLKPTPVGNRPTVYTKKLGERICDLIAQGWTLEQVCWLPDMPALWRLTQWTRSDDHKDFSKAYWAAREAAIHLEMDDLDAELKAALEESKEVKKDPAKTGTRTTAKAATVTTQRIQALRERRQHLEFKLTNLMPHIFRGSGRRMGKNADAVENKEKIGGLAAAARKGTTELLDRGVIDPNTREVTLKVVEGGKK